MSIYKVFFVENRALLRAIFPMRTFYNFSQLWDKDYTMSGDDKNMSIVSVGLDRINHYHDHRTHCAHIFKYENIRRAPPSPAHCAQHKHRDLVTTGQSCTMHIVSIQ